MSSEAAAEELSSESFRRSLPSLLLLASVMLLNFISRVIFSPLLPQIEIDLGINHVAAGSFFLLISCGYFLSMLFSGLVSSRLGHKWTIVISALGSGITLFLIGFCTTLIGIRVGLFFLGCAAGLYLQSGLATIFSLVTPSYFARGIAVHELAPNVGFVLAPLLSALMLTYVSWQEGLQLLGIVIVLVGFYYSLRGRGTAENGKAMDFSLLSHIVSIPQFWLMVLLFSFAICSTLGIYSMLPLYLVTEHGMELDGANKLVSLSRVSSVFMPLVAGWIGDRFGNRRVMIVSLLACGICTIPLGFSSGYVLLVFVVLQPMLSVCFFPSGFAVLARVGGEKVQGMAVSLCIPLAFLVGGGLIPLMIGAVGDYFSLAAGFTLVGCLTACIGTVTCLVDQKENI